MLAERSDQSAPRSRLKQNWREGEIELLLKQVLETINPILIYKDIDETKPEKHTVSLEQALARLENLRVPREWTFLARVTRNAFSAVVLRFQTQRRVRASNSRRAFTL